MWPKGPYTWIEDRTLYVSVPFTWNLPEVKRLCLQQDFRYDHVVVGGPAVSLMPEYLSGVAEIRDVLPGVLQKVNPQATRTTEGCPNGCGFCGVKKIYPEYRELKDWPVLPVICDDNLLMASYAHFRDVIGKLQKLDWCDFNQGLQAGRIGAAVAYQLAQLKNPIIRLAWDEMRDESGVINAINHLHAAGIPKKNVRCFVLIGWQDTPDEALYRLETIRDLGLKPNPMRYTPLDVLKKSAYANTEKGWTEDLLLDYMKYWSKLQFFGGLPFKDFDRKLRKAK